MPNERKDGGGQLNEGTLRKGGVNDPEYHIPTRPPPPAPMKPREPASPTTTPPEKRER